MTSTFTKSHAQKPPSAAEPRLEGELSKQVLATADAAEGMAAFAEKRQPLFKGE